MVCAWLESAHGVCRTAVAYTGPVQWSCIGSFENSHRQQLPAAYCRFVVPAEQLMRLSEVLMGRCKTMWEAQDCSL